MRLYNTLTRTIDEIVPLQAPAVTVYTCGPTVYDYAHIGHWFNYVRMDTLIRTLKLTGLVPQWVMNITDVGHLVSDADEGEDKLEKGARREGKTAWQVAEYYTKDFLEGMKLLNITTPDHITKATDHIAEQIELVTRLEAKGYTYVIDDGVYYDTSKFEGYAAFARLDLGGQQAGVRVEYNSQKRNPTDFAVWKFSPTGQHRDMEWDSPWSPLDFQATNTQATKGFPGWHIECSAMSMKYLGDTLDIHTGGIDHIPVHHTNEIAQSEAATGKRFANYWMHSNHVMFEGEKISKSLGNGVRLQALIDEGISTSAVRLHILESHYRSQSQFSRESLLAAQRRLQDIYAWADLRWQQQLQPQTQDNGAATLSDIEKIYADARSAILVALQNDLGTPQALMALSNLITATIDVAADRHAQATDDNFHQDMLTFLDNAFGLGLSDRPDISDAQKQLITERQAARSSKDWVASDAIRDRLSEQGIRVRDSAHGAYWYRL